MPAAQFGMIPGELRALPQWVVWRLVQRDGEAKPTKPLYSPRTGLLARTHDQEGKTYPNKPEDTWATFPEALEYGRKTKAGGIGFVFTETDPYCGIDIDGCVSRGRPNDEACSVIGLLKSYTEFSPSGNGIHVIVRGKLPAGGRRKGAVELYDRARYFTFTGNLLDGMPAQIEYRQKELEELHRSVFGNEPKYATVQARPMPNDYDLLDKARGGSSGGKFRLLYDYGDVSAYDGDDSRADLALCNMIAFWAGPDEARIDRLFRGSALYRKKWDRADYSRHTIGKALANRTEFYSANGGVKSNGAYSAPAGTVDESTGEIKSFNLTEYGDAERLVSLHGEDIRYCQDSRSWLIWDGQRWREDRAVELDARIKNTLRSLYIEAALCNDDDRRKQLIKHAHQAENSRRLGGIERFARSEPKIPISYSQLNGDPFLFNCASGTVNLRTGVPGPPRREDLITKVSPVEYDEFATAPLWERFLARVLPDDDVRAFIQRAAGYALTADVGEQCFFFLHGAGANGKSVLLATLLAVMGEYGIQSVHDLLLARSGTAIRPDIADLAGMRFVSTIEVEEGCRIAEGLAKQLTGGDAIRARRLYENTFQFAQTHKIFMAANHKPTIRGTDLAIWRRVRLVPFTETIPPNERDPQLTNKLLKELPGILNWCVAGCLDWQSSGLNPPDAVIASAEEYRLEQDVKGRFIEELCLLTGRVNATELYQAYQKWSEANGEKWDTQTAFGAYLGDKGFRKIRQGAGVFRGGISLRGSSLYDE